MSRLTAIPIAAMKNKKLYYQMLIGNIDLSASTSNTATTVGGSASDIVRG